MIQIIFSDLREAQRNQQLNVKTDREVGLCSVNPGFDVDLYLATNLRTMTEIWMGHTTLARAKERGDLTVMGSSELEADLGIQFKLSPFAKVEKLVAC